MSTRHFLTEREYELCILGGLRQAGLSDEQARTLINSRWPMTAVDALSELSGRGRLLTLEDLQRWVHQFAGPDVDVRDVILGPENVQHLLDWSVYHGIGEPTFTGLAAQERPETLDALLRGVVGSGGLN